MGGIRVCHVSKTLDSLFTLNNISLEVLSQQFAVILGPSGCGKSTLLNIIAGLMQPDQGQIELDGQIWTGRSGRVSYMQQKDLLLPSRDVLNNVCIPLILKGMGSKEARAHAQSYLKDFGLEGFEKYYPRQLSGGMRQRAALLRTYLFTSDIMLMDEPFAGLDAITRHKMQRWLKQICANYQPSVLFVTHDIDEALMLADIVYVFSSRPARVVMKINLAEYGDLNRSKFKKEVLAWLDADDNVN